MPSPSLSYPNEYANSSLLLRIRHRLATIWEPIAHLEQTEHPMSQPIDELSEMLTALTRYLVDHPDDLRVDPISEGDTVVFQVHTHPQDVGMLIGSGGRTARSLRVILNAAALKMHFRPILDICSPEDDEEEHRGAAD